MTYDAAAVSFRDPSERVAWRWTVYALLICLATGVMAGRILSVKSKSGKTPMLSANDRSRWANVRSLVDHGTYAVDDVVFLPNGKRDPEWYSIDMVKHRGPDGREHYYSSKPTLFNTLLAGPYWLMQRLTGTTLAQHPFHVIRTLLLVLNLVPLIIYFGLFAWVIERLGTTDFGRVFAMGAATSGTYLTTFAVTINNHLPAAISVMASIAILLQIGWLGKRSIRWFTLAGFALASVPVNELPGLSFFGLAAAGLLWIAPRQTLIAFLPPVVLIAAASLGTNYLAHGTWSTPYAHRGDGEVIAELDAVSPSALVAGPVTDELREALTRGGMTVSPTATIQERPEGRGWSLWDEPSQRRLALVAEPAGSADTDRVELQVRAWDHWYEYENSYWTAGTKQGVDRGEPSKATYAFHVLLGHHGWFSLTPLWLASLVGAWCWLRSDLSSHQAIAGAMLLLTVVCLVFFIALRPLEDRNYGGVSCCFRWMLWLIPFWLLGLVAAADAAADRRWARAALLGLLVVSVLSATYNEANPWSHPWLFQYWSDLGWIRY